MDVLNSLPPLLTLAQLLHCSVLPSVWLVTCVCDDLSLETQRNKYFFNNVRFVKKSLSVTVNHRNFLNLTWKLPCARNNLKLVPPHSRALLFTGSNQIYIIPHNVPRLRPLLLKQWPPTVVESESGRTSGWRGCDGRLPHCFAANYGRIVSCPAGFHANHDLLYILERRRRVIIHVSPPP